MLQQQSPLASVDLVYVTNYGDETPIAMTGGWDGERPHVRRPQAEAGLRHVGQLSWAVQPTARAACSSCPVPGRSCPFSAPAAQPGSDTYTASIPAAAAPVGALVRWFVQATDAAGQVTRDPPFRKDSDRQYWGTIVKDGSDQSSLPVMEL